jgi:hypothetical protein
MFRVLRKSAPMKTPATVKAVVVLIVLLSLATVVRGTAAAPPLGILAAAVIACICIGYWNMRRWAPLLYAALAVVHMGRAMLALSTGDLRIPLLALLFHAVLLVPAAFEWRRMTW